jgi:hypothetical protein
MPFVIIWNNFDMIEPQHRGDLHARSLRTSRARPRHSYLTYLPHNTDILYDLDSTPARGFVP